MMPQNPTHVYADYANATSLSKQTTIRLKLRKTAFFSRRGVLTMPSTDANLPNKRTVNGYSPFEWKRERRDEPVEFAGQGSERQSAIV
jgi:hypothetical protein